MPASSIPPVHPRGVAPRRRRPQGPARGVARVLLATLLAVLGTLVWAPAASAHDELLDLQPGNKVVVTTPPTQVQLVFGAAVLAVGTQIRVTGPGNTVVSTGTPAIDSGTVVEKLAGALPDGVYRVDWRVTSADGHPVSGTYTFTLDTKATPSVPATSSTTAASTPPPSTSPAVAAGGTGGTTSSGSGSSIGLYAGLGVLAGAVAGAALAFVRLRKRASVSNEGNQQK